VNILVDIIHPAHVHFFRNAINIWAQKGHNITITARQKDVTLQLLNNFNLEHTCLSKVGKGLTGLGIELITRDLKLWNFCRKAKPDILTGISGIFIAHVGKMLNKPSIVWDDTEHQSKAHKLTWPLATRIMSPDCYLKKPVKKQTFYPGCHELAYLTPEYFKPDINLVKQAGINTDKPYCVIRLISWGAHHDVGQHGFDHKQIIQFLEKLSNHAQPYLSVEGNCPPQLQKYQLNIPVHLIHHALAFASLVVGEGSTMISEAACLGTPAIYVNTLKLGYINMLEKYGLIKQSTNMNNITEYCMNILAYPQTKQNALSARNKLLKDKTNVTELIVKTIINCSSAK
jgi:uncharacterized protein